MQNRTKKTKNKPVKNTNSFDLKPQIKLCQPKSTEHNAPFWLAIAQF